MTIVGIGFAGVGFMGQVAHLRNYANRQDCRIAITVELCTELAWQWLPCDPSRRSKPVGATSSLMLE